MKHRHWSRLALVALAAAACGAAAAPAAAVPGPAATATAYLQARTAAVTAADPGAVLATWTTPAGTLAATERAVARGTALRAAQLGHRIDSVGSETTVLAVCVLSHPAAAGSSPATGQGSPPRGSETVWSTPEASVLRSMPAECHR